MAARKKKARRKKVAPDSRGLAPEETRAGDEPGALRELEARIAAARGELIGRYRDPLGGRWLALAALPVSQVAPTPFQRDLSDAHAKRLTDVLERVGVFLDPLSWGQTWGVARALIGVTLAFVAVAVWLMGWGDLGKSTRGVTPHPAASIFGPASAAANALE